MRHKTPEQAQRVRDRKTERKMADIPGNQNNKGRSLMKIMQDELDEKMLEWTELDYTNRDKKVKLRGEVRGLAIGLAIILRPYDDRIAVAKKIEKYSLKRIRSNAN